jgi:hypothetical protein
MGISRIQTRNRSRNVQTRGELTTTASRLRRRLRSGGKRWEMDGGDFTRAEPQMAPSGSASAAGFPERAETSIDLTSPRPYSSGMTVCLNPILLRYIVFGKPTPIPIVSAALDLHRGILIHENPISPSSRPSQQRTPLATYISLPLAIS